MDLLSFGSIGPSRYQLAAYAKRDDWSLTTDNRQPTAIFLKKHRACQLTKNRTHRSKNLLF